MQPFDYFIIAAAGAFYLLLIVGGGIRAFKRGGLCNHLLFWTPIAALIPGGLFFAGPQWVTQGEWPRILLAAYALTWLVMALAYVMEPLTRNNQRTAIAR